MGTKDRSGLPHDTRRLTTVLMSNGDEEGRLHAPLRPSVFGGLGSGTLLDHSHCVESYAGGGVSAQRGHSARAASNSKLAFS